MLINFRDIVAFIVALLTSLLFSGASLMDFQRRQVPTFDAVVNTVLLGIVVGFVVFYIIDTLRFGLRGNHDNITRPGTVYARPKNGIPYKRARRSR